jgi:hypothetical protein
MFDRKERYARMRQAPCLHCGKPATSCRQLCAVCYRNKTIREQYATMNDTAERKGRPERQAGDPPYRCLWCSQWRCQEPLRTCSACAAWYRERALDMPAH